MAVVLITGSSSGIGKLSALEFARRGHRVFASMRRLESARYILADAQKEGLTIETLQLDVTDAASVRTAVEGVLRREGRLDVLLNNAGFGSFGPIEDYTDEELREVFETNLFGAIRTTRAVLPAMRARRSGTIVMVSSISGLRTFPFMAVYSASKFALEAISNGLRCELKPFGVRVVMVEPGNFNTRAGINMHFPQKVKSGSPSDPLYLRLIEKRRIAGKNVTFGNAREVARVIADAAEAKEPEARYLVGKDAEQLVGLTPLSFERMIDEMMSLRAED
ncbi:MAG TPA: SDR family oxidoreductase [Candidatus Sulfotelmatobacter sp.]|nr:SDR family oxidoreductase [Candidatus Sulfotelmatobacter sp.]